MKCNLIAVIKPLRFIGRRLKNFQKIPWWGNKRSSGALWRMMLKVSSKIIKLSVIFILLIIIYLPTFIWMLGRFDAPNTYYSHGYLVPLISLALIYLKRDKLKVIKKDTCSLGLVLIITSLFLYVLSLILDIGFYGGSIIFNYFSRLKPLSWRC